MRKFAAPRWSKLLAAARLTGPSQARLVAELVGGTRQVGRKFLGAGAEGVAFPAFTPGHGASVIKQFYSRPFGANIAERAALMNQFPNLFAKVLHVNPAAERMVVERLKPIQHWDYGHLASVEDHMLLRSSRSPGPGEYILSMPNRRKFSVSDVRQSNIGLDQFGTPKVMDPIVEPWKRLEKPLRKPTLPWLKDVEIEALGFTPARHTV